MGQLIARSNTFPRSERVKTDSRSIDTFRVPFPAVLKLKSCDFAVKNADAPGVQKQTFTSRKSIRAQWEKAVTHRDYSFRGDYIRVSMFDDRLEIVSPGALPNIVTLDNMRTTRYSRNPRIARTLVEFGWVRELNEGVKRIYTEMQDSLLNDPVYTEPGGTKVQLTLENNIVARTVRRSEALEDRLSAEAIASLGGYELAAVRLVFTNGKVTARGLAEHIGRDRRTASRVLGKLIGEGGLLEWHGSSPNDPRQFYTIR